MMSIDASELRLLTHDLGAAGPAALAKVQPILHRAANNIKRAMIADANKSRHFRQIASTITYDATLGGQLSFEAEIGYDKSKGPAAALAGIAIFGTSRPGGGTVRNPEEALNDEAPEFERWLGDAVGGLL
jgi:hypothetical protein